nr:hypothetical protein [Tanacetum cinerariifolium]
VKAGHDLIRGPSYDARTIARAADREEDSVEDLAVTQMMRIHALEARSRTDTVEDADSSHINKNCSKLKNHGNDSENGVAQGRAYALRGRDASPDSNIITAQEYLSKGCDVILAHITTKEAMDKPKGK